MKKGTFVNIKGCGENPFTPYKKLETYWLASILFLSANSPHLVMKIFCWEQ